MENVSNEMPIYSLKKNKNRAIIPKVLLQIVLGIIFYLGILLNIALLSIEEIESIVKFGSLVLIIIIVMVGIYSAIRNAGKPYFFFRDRISVAKKNIFYSSIITVKPKENLFDKIFKTYSLNLGNKNNLENIPKSVDIKSYLEKLIVYNKKG